MSGPKGIDDLIGELNDDNVQDLSNRIKIADAIRKGKLQTSLIVSDFDMQDIED